MYQKDYPFGTFTFATKQIEKIEYSPGCWNGLKIGIYHVPLKQTEEDDQLIWDQATLIGTYDYNYSWFNEKRFSVFKRNARWFALYSIDYTATRLMEIFQDENNQWTWKDLGGEDRDSMGFCPVELYVPMIYDLCMKDKEDPPSKQLKIEEEIDGDKVGYGSEWFIRTYKPEYGYVAGCIWGDDTSWKIQLIDLKDVESGTIKRIERFGYIELPHKSNLREAVQASYSGYVCGYNRRIVKIAILGEFDIETGEFLGEYMNIANQNRKGLKSGIIRFSSTEDFEQFKNNITDKFVSVDFYYSKSALDVIVRQATQTQLDKIKELAGPNHTFFDDIQFSPVE